MDHTILLIAETGSDIPAALAAELGIILVPMHVNMDNQTLDDGAFPATDVCAYYDRTGTVPTTSGCTPYDFETVFDDLHTRYPEKKFLHLAYSAVTTCSYHSALLAAENREYVKSVDTRHVSVGQCAVVLAVHQWLQDHPDASLEEAATTSERISAETKMCFIPRNLDYLRAGGRVSNAAALVGNLLHLHPCIEIIDGRLIAGKKYRGALSRLAPSLLQDFDNKNHLSRDHIYFINTPYMDGAVRSALEAKAADMGFRSVTWIPTGCVITSHGGPGAFGIVGTSK